MKATHLRKNLFRTLEKVAQTGKPVDVESKGRRFRIIALSRSDRFTCLEKHPDVFSGDLDDLVKVDWMSDWRP